ncbi:MAG: hypothetical protein K2Z80_19770 [Xanthobacteraceae bacterium]|nr:hypothetical protein [Xanthobacteraceae bacterium]
MAGFEIVYRCTEGDRLLRSPPRDAAAARARLDEGNRNLVSLFAQPENAETGRMQSIAPVGFVLSGAVAQHPLPWCWAVPMRACRSN